MRLDLLLVRLRFAKSRSAAWRLIDPGHIRKNGQRVTEHDHKVCAGDVLTLPLGSRVKIVQIERLPERRGPAEEARGHYRTLDAGKSFAIAE